MSRRAPLYAICMALVVMSTTPTDIHLGWQWALGFIAGLAAGLAGQHLSRRVARLALIVGTAVVVATALDFLTRRSFQSPPAMSSSTASILQHTPSLPS